MDADLWSDGQRLPPAVTAGLLSRSECALRERRVRQCVGILIKVGKGIFFVFLSLHIGPVYGHFGLL